LILSLSIKILDVLIINDTLTEVLVIFKMKKGVSKKRNNLGNPPWHDIHILFSHFKTHLPLFSRESIDGHPFFHQESTSVTISMIIPSSGETLPGASKGVWLHASLTSLVTLQEACVQPPPTSGRRDKAPNTSRNSRTRVSIILSCLAVISKLSSSNCINCLCNTS
jgi:hypothetical protein